MNYAYNYINYTPSEFNYAIQYILNTFSNSYYTFPDSNNTLVFSSKTLSNPSKWQLLGNEGLNSSNCSTEVIKNFYHYSDLSLGAWL